MATRTRLDSEIGIQLRDAEEEQQGDDQDEGQVDDHPIRPRLAPRLVPAPEFSQQHADAYLSPSVTAFTCRYSSMP